MLGGKGELQAGPVTHLLLLLAFHFPLSPLPVGVISKTEPNPVSTVSHLCQAAAPGPTWSISAAASMTASFLVLGSQRNLFEIVKIQFHPQRLRTLCASHHT